ncbi:MAG: tricarballylate utilization 4Fe-4S protein TcuB [Gammaproteobacteria bacterium]|nr:tricarballylate utilization 4Fe-4S protein TcuB [Gammaproteobacteria bacterium]MBU0787384.1 tricarballylate utilization 4Fe-4S protein TcuB [Gammaproteobacteria bacterium]MBU0816469.1 tricarballylate utilization 4Fe-4S protein TcuB [Gammaproteobacteria bacterium]MBU1787663.1 tricarballylate utilization 4Fe-4S protein TcuB [Gammaproteobacteria bacterium]
MSLPETTHQSVPSLATLTRQARALASGEVVPGTPEAEVARQLQICNACRYCEGFCAVFPAMTRRLDFGKADIHYLANLCHNCGACLHACQYAPPHEFAVNVPQSMAKVRLQTYADYAWPPALGQLYQRNGLTLSLAVAAALAFFMLLTLWLKDTLWRAPPLGDFYSIFPHNLMVALFAPVFLFAVLALTLGLRRFWREITPGHDYAAPALQAVQAAAAAEATHDVLRLKYLDGGHGEGCNNADDAWTLWRRRFHHATFYGFVLCFAATSVATLYHYVAGWTAPYDLPSLPKLLGAVGGVSLLIGTAGLYWLNLRRHPQHGDAAQKPMDLGFIALLFFISLTGLGLWWARGTGAMPALLALHLGVVMALFLTLPYGKFAHGFFRSAALLKWALEKRLPSKLQPGAD